MGEPVTHKRRGGRYEGRKRLELHFSAFSCRWSFSSSLKDLDQHVEALFKFALVTDEGTGLGRTRPTGPQVKQDVPGMARLIQTSNPVWP